MKVLAWVPEPRDRTPGQRFRIEQWDPHLRRLGIEVEYAPFADEAVTALLKQPEQALAKACKLGSLLIRRLREVASLRGVDLVYLFRESALLGPALVERVLRLRKIPYVFDFDDAVWVRYRSPTNAHWAALRFPGKAATSCRLAHHVMAGNEYLASYARRHNDQVSIVPTTIDLDRYVPPPSPASGEPIIGWTGSYSTAQYLRLVAPVLRRLLERHRFRFVTVGAGKFELPGVPLENRPWSATTEVLDLADFAIGIMPLPNAEWERGKCGLKALQYMALGVPAVVSPVGVNGTIISDGHNGFLASTPEEWESRLDMLLRDEALRRRLGQQGRATVEKSYSAAIHAPRVAALFREAAFGMKAKPGSVP